MEGWFEFTSLEGKRRSRHVFDVLSVIESQESGVFLVCRRGTEHQDKIHAAESYDEIVLRMTNAIERERAYRHTRETNRTATMIQQ